MTSRVLLDTNIVSELRRARPHLAVLKWLSTVTDSDLFLSAVTLGEIHAGIELSREQDSVKATKIEDWAEQVAATYNILAMDAHTVRIWAKLMHRRSDALYEDAMIAATAKQHQLTVVTRNTADFTVFGVDVLNPFR